MKTKLLLLEIGALIVFAACRPTEPEAESQDMYLSRSFKWDVTLSKEDGIVHNSSVTIGKDTILDGKTYRMVDSYPMRQTKNCIFIYDQQTKKDILLYDFSLQVGDSIEQLEDPYNGIPKRQAKVIKTETITLADGRKARRIEYEQTYPAPRDPDIEFVGTAKRGILGPLDNMLIQTSLNAFYDNNILLYPLPKDCYAEMQLINQLGELTDDYLCLVLLANYGCDLQTAYTCMEPEILEAMEDLKSQYMNSELWDADRTEIRLTKHPVRNAPREDMEYTAIEFYMYNINPSNDYRLCKIFRVIDSEGNAYNINY